jgi:hypothetical protein
VSSPRREAPIFEIDMEMHPPPMKLWEAVSAFREFPHILAEVFSSERWRATHGDSFSRYDELVRAQDRATLDSYLPLELTREIASRCDALQFCFSPGTGILRRATPCSILDRQTHWIWGLTLQADDVTLTAGEVHDRFGGSIIEEVLEFGSARVTNRA